VESRPHTPRTPNKIPEHHCYHSGGTIALRTLGLASRELSCHVMQPPERYQLRTSLPCVLSTDLGFESVKDGKTRPGERDVLCQPMAFDKKLTSSQILRGGTLNTSFVANEIPHSTVGHSFAKPIS
jgi:hypothetical protein